MPLGRTKDENRTRWDFELRDKLDILVDLNFGCIVAETADTEDKYRWKHLDEDVPDRIG